VYHFNMNLSNFYSILDELPRNEQVRNSLPFFFYEDRKTFTDREFIKKMWVACAKHGYISIEGSTMKELIDKMQIITIITYKTLTFPNLTPFGTDTLYKKNGH
jgi:hypothetical protein